MVMVLILKLSFPFRFVIALAFHFSLTLVKIYLVMLFRCLLISLMVFICQLTHFVRQRCLAVVFKCAQKYSCSTLFNCRFRL